MPVPQGFPRLSTGSDSFSSLAFYCSKYLSELLQGLLQPGDSRATLRAGAAVILPCRLLPRNPSLLDEVPSDAPGRLAGPRQVYIRKVAGDMRTEPNPRDDFSADFAEVLNNHHRGNALRTEVVRGSDVLVLSCGEEGRAIEVVLRGERGGEGLRNTAVGRRGAVVASRHTVFHCPVHHSQTIRLWSSGHRRDVHLRVLIRTVLLFVPELPVLLRPALPSRRSGQEGLPPCVALLYVRFNRCFGSEDQAAVETAEVAGVLAPRSHVLFAKEQEAELRLPDFHIKLHRNSLKLPCCPMKTPLTDVISQLNELERP